MEANVPPSSGASARSAERKTSGRGRRLDEGYHILGVLRLQVGVGIVIESALGKPLHQRPEILAYYLFVKLGKHAALLLEIGWKLRVGVQAMANLPVVSGHQQRSHSGDESGQGSVSKLGY